MKNVLPLLFSFFSFSFYGQIKNDRYEVTAPAKLIISSLNIKNQDEISGKLSSGETAIIRKQHLKLKLIINANEENEILKEIDANVDEKITDKIPFLELYEYDFNNDGKKELLVMSSPDANSFHVLEVYKHNSGFVKKVGNFLVGVTVTFDKNLMSIYSGVSDSHINFLYFENQFWKLNWHDPNREAQ